VQTGQAAAHGQAEAAPEPIVDLVAKLLASFLPAIPLKVRLNRQRPLKKRLPLSAAIPFKRAADRKPGQSLPGVNGGERRRRLAS
jgi:hypothetical protein